MRHQNRVLSKYFSLCTCNCPFYSAYKSLVHRVDFGQFKLSTDIEKNPGPSVYVDATKTIHASYCQGNVVVFGENVGQQCVAMSPGGVLPYITCTGYVPPNGVVILKLLI